MSQPGTITASAQVEVSSETDGKLGMTASGTVEVDVDTSGVGPPTPAKPHFLTYAELVEGEVGGE